MISSSKNGITEFSYLCPKLAETLWEADPTSRTADFSTAVSKRSVDNRTRFSNLGFFLGGRGGGVAPGVVTGVVRAGWLMGSEFRFMRGGGGTNEPALVSAGLKGDGARGGMGVLEPLFVEYTPGA